MSDGQTGLWVNIGETPIDLNSGMIEAVTNPPQGFVSKHSFVETDIVSRVRAIDWFAQCGQPHSLDLSMKTEQVTDWPTAITSCKDSVWENVELEAQNQLTLWLHLNDRAHYQKLNEIASVQRNYVLNPLSAERIAPFQIKHGLDAALTDGVRWDVLGALIENAFLNRGHKVFFFLELHMVYEAGHFPCGWEGDWPQGKLRVL